LKLFLNKLHFKALLIYLGFVQLTVAQINGVDRFVISSGGNGQVTIGETVIGFKNTAPHYFLIGFQQPNDNSVVKLSALPFVFTGSIANTISCIGNNDGKYKLVLNNVYGNIKVQFGTINDSGDTTNETLENSANVNFAQKNYDVDGLKKGKYIIRINYNSAVGQTPSTSSSIFGFEIAEGIIACSINPNNGLTPNGDGLNDEWFINGADLHSNMKVDIFNRWGQSIWSTGNYNNTSNAFKGLNNQGQKVADGTYFYIITTEDNAVMKGWLEIVSP
jgi:gliding motility-associated-like protein